MCPQRNNIFQLVFLLDYKGWLNFVHFNEQQLFACLHPRSVESFLHRAPSQMREKKKHLWSGELGPGGSGRTVSGAFKQQQRGPSLWACPCRACQLFPSWMCLLRRTVQNVFGRTQDCGCPKQPRHPQARDCYCFGVEVRRVQFCIQICSCNYLLGRSPGSWCLPLWN